MSGLGRGGPTPLQPALQADLFGTTAMGSIQGMLSLGSSITGVIGPVLIAWLVDASGAYPVAWLVLSALMLSAVPLLLATKLPAREAT